MPARPTSDWPAAAKRSAPARFAGVLVLAVTTAVLAFAPVSQASVKAASAAAGTPAAPAAKRWSPSWMTGQKSFTLDEALAAASRFDVVVAQPTALAPYVVAMHAAYPSVKVLAYVNGAYTKTATYPESLYAHDLLGQRITWIPFGLTMLEMSNAATRAVVVSAAAIALATAPFDGVLLDNLGLTSLNDSDKTGLPIDPASLVTYTGAAWLAQTATLLRDVHASFPTATVLGNGLAWGKLYSDLLSPTSVLAQLAISGESEQFVRAATQAVTTFRKEADWKMDVDMLVDSEQRGAPVAVVTKLWVTATDAQREAWHRYALATFLLGDNGTSWFSFLGDQALPTAIAGSTLERTRIGVPAGAYSKVSGAYQRSYSNGLVLVNPTTKAANVPVTGSYTNLNGVVVTGTISLAPQTAEILTLN